MRELIIVSQIPDENYIERVLVDSSRYEKGNPAECDRNFVPQTGAISLVKIKGAMQRNYELRR